MTRARRAEWKRAVGRAIRYRTEHYGYFHGFGNRAWNPKTAAQNAQVTEFFGISVSLNQRIIPALHCVERELKERCADHPYQPAILSGLRKKNTYFDGDASNHVYGIALDIDPTLNPCCQCLRPWKDSPLCQGKKTIWERMSMPKCWVEVFEKYGFYWLGHDQLQDSMHFEFLGDPARILASASAPDAG